MPNPVEGILEIYEDMVKVLLVLEMFLTTDHQVEMKICSVVLLSALKPARSSTIIFFNLLSMISSITLLG